MKTERELRTLLVATRKLKARPPTCKCPTCLMIDLSQATVINLLEWVLGDSAEFDRNVETTLAEAAKL